MNLIKLMLIFLYHIAIYGHPDIFNRRIAITTTQDIPSIIETFKLLEEYCPIGQPLKTRGSKDSFLLCGQCKPLGDCPPTHFCKLDEPSKPGYCCPRKSGTAEGAVWQNLPAPSLVIELSNIANESVNAVVQNERVQVDNETDNSEEKEETTLASNKSSVVQKNESATITEASVTTTQTEKDNSTDLPTGIQENSTIKLKLTTRETDPPNFSPPIFKELYRTTASHPHSLSGDVSDNALALNWPFKITTISSPLPSKIVVQEKLARLAVQRLPSQQDGLLTFSHMLSSPEFDSASGRFLSSPDDYWKDGGKLALSSGRFRPCTSHSNCFQLREPPEWCRVGRSNTFEWTDRSCFCSFNATLPGCVIQRKNNGVLEWTFCSSYRNNVDCIS